MTIATLTTSTVAINAQFWFASVPTIVLTNEDEMSSTLDMLNDAFPNHVFTVGCHNGYMNSIQFFVNSSNW